MTADERPTVPTELDRPGREALAELAAREPATIRAVSAYLTDLAAWRERADGETSTESTPSDSETYPDGVPSHASISVTEIAGTEYYYYQWREDDEIRSETVRR
ncbi:hypothetical protein [Natrinema sp. 74]|uniref:hypothetical protein n=1 Tax=Natrinema sp. 74 TaxID=3384159 RepID=UPI0038D4368A